MPRAVGALLARQPLEAGPRLLDAADDVADDGGPRAGRIAMLDRWRKDLARLYAGKGTTPLTEGLAGPIALFHGTVNYTATNHGGYTDDTGVVMRIVNGDWKLDSVTTK